jgi:hypothetical protein
MGFNIGKIKCWKNLIVKNLNVLKNIVNVLI